MLDLISEGLSHQNAVCSILYVFMYVCLFKYDSSSYKTSNRQLICLISRLKVTLLQVM